MANQPHSQNRTGLVDPSRPGEYPVLLGDTLAGQHSLSERRFIGVRYNHRPKNDSARYKNIIRPVPASLTRLSLTLEDAVAASSQNPITFKYRGSPDPKSSAKEGSQNVLALILDPSRKAFILEPVSSELNFNLKASPGQTEKQLLQKYEQLDILDVVQGASNENEQLGRNGSASDEDFSAPDDDNPYDYRHFFQKDKEDQAATPRIGFEPSPSPNLLPTALSTKVANQQPPIAKAKPKPAPRTKASASSARTLPSKPRAKPKPKSAEKVTEIADRDSSADEKPGPRRRSTQVKGAPAIQVEDDLVIDMGSPPPAARTRKINVEHFASSNNTSANEADDDEVGDRSEDDDIEHLRLPSPAPQVKVTPSVQADDDDDDGLAAEMEAALEESANEEEAMGNQLATKMAEDESEVSEEE